MSPKMPKLPHRNAQKNRAADLGSVEHGKHASESFRAVAVGGATFWTGGGSRNCWKRLLLPTPIPHILQNQFLILRGTLFRTCAEGQVILLLRNVSSPL